MDVDETISVWTFHNPDSWIFIDALVLPQMVFLTQCFFWKSWVVPLFCRRLPTWRTSFSISSPRPGLNATCVFFTILHYHRSKNMCNYSPYPHPKWNLKKKQSCKYTILVQHPSCDIQRKRIHPLKLTHPLKRNHLKGKIHPPTTNFLWDILVFVLQLMFLILPDIWGFSGGI